MTSLSHQYKDEGVRHLIASPPSSFECYLIKFCSKTPPHRPHTRTSILDSSAPITCPSPQTTQDNTNNTSTALPPALSTPSFPSPHDLVPTVSFKTPQKCPTTTTKSLRTRRGDN
ncbi:hypothetical protein ElyMa_004355300 [Elysia marginata]|uniref:Uncharacterized protein n=1 Tax=Elysia marginata TaxID=1093978 RepID=A0AAV4H389_9GAST|nr:hypothetical protein ElyMa_004355300 [Elysia marginata]